MLSKLGQGVAFGSEPCLAWLEVFGADRLREMRVEESVLLSEVLRAAGGELSRFFPGRDGEPYGRKRSTLLQIPQLGRRLRVTGIRILTPIPSLASKAACASRMLNLVAAVFTHSLSASGERAPESGGFRKNPTVSTGSNTCTR